MPYRKMLRNADLALVAPGRLLRASLLLLLLSIPALAQELELQCRLIWVSEGCRKTLPILFNPLSQGFQLENDAPDSGPMHVCPQIDELDKKGVRQTLDFYTKEWAEVQSRSLKLAVGDRQILPYLDEVLVPGKPEDHWPLQLPVGSEIDLQHLRRQGESILKVTCRGFWLRMEMGKPLCRWTTTTRELPLRPNKIYSFAGLLSAEPPLSPDSWLLKGHATLVDQRAELVLLIEEH